MNRLLSLTILLVYVTVINAQESTPLYLNTSKSFEERANDLVSRMTLEEKASQLGNSAPAIPRLGVNRYDWWNEALHGVARAGIATVFPQAIGMAASFDLDMMSKVADVISDEARAKHHEALRNNDYGRYKGLTYWSPNINIFRDPRWGRGHETYGEDPYLSGQMGMRFVKGLQGDDPKYFKLVATAKHYAVHNGPEPDRHTFNVVPNTRDLWETYLPAFEDLVVESKVYSVMGAYNRVDGESASASSMLLDQVLRKQWGFDGFVVSDCGAIRDIYANHKVVNTAAEAAAIGIRRGCDLNCGNVYQRSLIDAVNQGLIDEGEIDLALYRLMLGRMKLGMFDPEEMVPYAQIPISENDSPENDQVALEMALKTMTLLKNDGILPLNKKKIKSIAVVGPNANSVVALRANYYGEASHPVTVLDGIKNAMGKNVKVYFDEACPIVEYEGNQTQYNAIPGKYLSTVDDKGKKVQGLKGEYFKGTKFLGEPVLTRIDQEIKMNWNSGSPTATDVAQGILTAEQDLGNDNFSIRWTGKLVAPESGMYEFGVMSDDGCRIYLDGELILDDWSEHEMIPNVVQLQLQKDKSYDLRIDYYEAEGEAGIWLVWKKMDEEGLAKGPFKPAPEMLANVKKADVAIFVGGLNADWEGEEMRGRNGIDGFEGGDRTKIELPESQLQTLRAMKETGTPVIFVLVAGSAISFKGLEDELPAILMAWYPGQRGGDAVADVLFGDYNPAGRLPVTFYKSTDDLADFRDYNMRAGKGFTYRYFQDKPLYSFGHGLSYTSFEYSDLKLDKASATSTEPITVSVKIKNTGSRDGEEVVQLYVHDVESTLPMPVKQLREFQRIALAKGEEKTVSFTLQADKDMRYYNAMSRAYEVEPGAFELQLGASSSDIRQKATIVIK